MFLTATILKNTSFTLLPPPPPPFIKCHFILLLLQSFTFGYKRAEILGALLSIVTIWYVTGVLVYLVSPNSGPVQVLTISENAGGRSSRVVQ